MKSCTIQLLEGDQKAMGWIRKNLEVRANNNTLSQKLLQLYPTTGGALVAIVPAWVNLNELSSYEYGWEAEIGDERYEDGSFPLDQLVNIVVDHLRADVRAVLVCENFGAIRMTTEYWSWGAQPPLARFRAEEVYHIFPHSTTDREAIENALGDALGRWGAAVCSYCNVVPVGDIVDEAFFDEIASKTVQIIVPAFDESGYIVWSPIHRQINGDRSH
jgi:hypothetical protein